LGPGNGSPGDDGCPYAKSQRLRRCRGGEASAQPCGKFTQQSGGRERSERFPQPHLKVSAGAEKQRFDGRPGERECRCDFFVGETSHLSQKECFALLGGELRNGGAQFADFVPTERRHVGVLPGGLGLGLGLDGEGLSHPGLYACEGFVPRDCH